MPVRLTETYLRSVIRQELKEMMGGYGDFASDPQGRVERFLASNAGKTVTIGQIADEADLAFDEVIDALVEIQIYYDDYDAPNIDMDLRSVPVMIDADFQMETDESPLAESKNKKQLKGKVKSSVSRR